MNIQFAAQSYRLGAYDAPPSKSAKGPASKVESGVQQESVEISDNSVSIQKVWDRIMTLPEVRIPIVEEIQRKIKNNDYPLDNRMNNALDKLIEGKILHVTA